jgi:hypothetical protein
VVLDADVYVGLPFVVFTGTDWPDAARRDYNRARNTTTRSGRVIPPSLSLLGTASPVILFGPRFPPWYGSGWGRVGHPRS